MNASNVSAWRNVWGLVLISFCIAAAPTIRGQTVLYETGFEVDEGYSSDFDLTGQEGWVGHGADGILTNFFEGLGQQAYIGFSVPAGDTNDAFSVYQPINFAPLSANLPLVKFSVRMQIVDTTSTNGPWDEFRWSVYNTNGVRLFSLIFDNAELLISYLLDDEKVVSTEKGFDSQGYYDLEIAMNFARGLWTATLNEEIIVNSQRITTLGSDLTLGDVDVIWLLSEPNFPGDNYLLFDNYRITAEPADSIAANLEVVGIEADGSFNARLFGEPGLVYRIEASSNLVDWQPLLTITTPSGGVLDFQDSTARDFPQRFYRALQGP